MRLVFILMAALVLPHTAGAHGDLHLRILGLTRQIETATNNPARLYLERGELQREHGDWAAAAADFQRAAETDPNLAAVDLCRARLLADSGKLEAALAMFDQAIPRMPGEGEAYVSRARLLVKMGCRQPALADYQKGLGVVSDPAPECYLEWAQQWVAEGNVAEALGALDQGIKKLGPVVKLQGYAVDLELSRKDNLAAVARLDTIITNAARKESWLAKRGEVLLAARRPAEAQQAFAAALAAVKKLPMRLQQSPAMEALQAKVNATLAGITNAHAAGKAN